MLFVDEFCGILVYIKFGADVTSQYEGEIATEPPATTKPQDTNVKTGDSDVTVLTFAVILLSAAAVILFTANRKRSCR